MRRSTRRSKEEVVKSDLLLPRLPVQSGLLLPEEILIEILLRLPVQMLLRCKCVSKHWLRLLSSQYFVQLHLTMHQINPIVGFISNKSSLLSLCSLEYETNSIKTSYQTKISSGSIVVGSCNGLVCLWKWDYVDSLVFLWNPATGEQIKVQHGLKNDDNLTFKGFGHDPVINTYKVVAIKNIWCRDENDDDDSNNDENDYDSCEAYIYTLGTKERRRIPISTSLWVFGVYNVPFVNGALHWISKWKSPVKTQCAANSIIAIDVGKEEFRELPWIQTSIDKETKVRLGALHGCLSLFSTTTYNGVTGIWSMKDYGIQESWTKLHIFTVELPMGCYNPTYITPLCIQRNGDILIEVTQGLFDVHRYLYTYNPTNNDDCHQYRQCDSDSNGVYTYVESLVSIASLNCDEKAPVPVGDNLKGPDVLLTDLIFDF